MARTTIQSNIKRNTKDFSEYSLFLGGLDISTKNIDQFDPLRPGYSRIFLVRMPRFMELFDLDMTKRFKHFVEMGFTAISGIGNTTLQFEDIQGGYANNKFQVPTVSQDETESITIRLYEMSGSPIREYIDTWITGISDPLTGLSHYHGMISDTCTFKASNHVMESFYTCTDPTGNLIEYACMLSNMMPKGITKGHFEFEAGSHAPVSLDLEFTATRYESPQINEICAALLNKYKILRDYLNFTSGYTVSDVNKMESYNSKINSI